MALGFCFTGWHHHEDQVYHILKIRRNGGNLVVAEYASLDPEELENQDSLVRETDPTENNLKQVAAQLINPCADRDEATLDGITVVENREWSKEHGLYLVKPYFIDDDGNDATVEQLRQLVFRHLDNAIAPVAADLDPAR